VCKKNCSTVRILKMSAFLFMYSLIQLEFVLDILWMAVIFGLPCIGKGEDAVHLNGAYV